MQKEQQRHYCLLGIELVCAILVAITAYLRMFQIDLDILTLLFLLLLLSAALFRYVTNPIQGWYQARALAESVKTSAWRYVMKAEPFDGIEDEAEKVFRELLERIEYENRELLVSFPHEPDSQIITSRMTYFRMLDEETRIELYKQNRVAEQEEWYCSKARKNKCARSISFILLITLSICAIVLCSISVWNEALSSVFPLDVVVIAVTSVISWTESKRYAELATSYQLAARDISILAEELPSAIKSSGLSAAVSDAEKAFSREHAEWLSRKDR